MERKFENFTEIYTCERLQIFKTKAEANHMMREWLKNARTVKSVTKDGRWILRDFSNFINQKSDIELLLVKDTLQERLKKISKNLIIRKLDAISNYDIHKKRFTLIETNDGNEHAIYTLRKGNVGCMYWSEHDNDIEEAKYFFNALLTEAEFSCKDLIKLGDKIVIERTRCKMAANLSFENNDNIAVNVVNISSKGLGLEATDELPKDLFELPAEVFFDSREPSRQLSLCGKICWDKADSNKYQFGFVCDEITNEIKDKIHSFVFEE